MGSELDEIRRDIKSLLIESARTNQKLEELSNERHLPPCKSLKKHIEDEHVNTMSRKVREVTVLTLIPVIVLSVAGYVYSLVVDDLIKTSVKNAVVDERE